MAWEFEAAQELRPGSWRAACEPQGVTGQRHSLWHTGAEAFTAQMESSTTDLLREILQPRLLQSNSAPKLNKEPGVEGRNRAAHPSQDDNTPASQEQVNGQQGPLTARAARLGSSTAKGLTPSCSLCRKGKKPNTNEWETGKGLNPRLAPPLSAHKRSLCSREPLSAVTTSLRDAFPLG